MSLKDEGEIPLLGPQINYDEENEVSVENENEIHKLHMLQSLQALQYIK